MRRYEEPVRALVTTDGSCVTSGREEIGLSTSRGSGGWAAVVEHGSEGWVLRGRVPETTSTRMETLAVIEGLRSLPAGTRVLVQTDVMIPGQWAECWRRGGLPKAVERADADLWAAFREELDRLGPVVFRFIQKRDAVSAHQRCHKFARAEARALAAERGHLSDGSKPKEERRHLREKYRELVWRQDGTIGERLAQKTGWEGGTMSGWSHVI